MPNEIKYPADPNGVLDSDSAPFLVGENSWVNGENFRTATTDSGKTKIVESVGGNILISEPMPSAVFITIGTIEDVVNVRFLKFQFNTTGTEHKIIVCYANTNIELNVLLSSQVIGGLNFDKNYPIHSVRIVNGLLYWTDNLNVQRKINIDAAIKLNNPSFVTDVLPYSIPIAQEVITIIRKPPAYPLTIAKITQTSPAVENNYIEDSAFQFSYRYYYRDGEKSVPSVYSVLAPYNSKGQTYNRIDVVVPLIEYIEQDVQSVDILVKYGNENTFFRVKSWNRSNPSQEIEIENHNAGTTALYYPFYNDTIGEAQDEAYSLKPFDSVPILSETLEVFDNRLGFANNLEGYDTPYETSLDVSLVSQGGGDTVSATIWVIGFNGVHRYSIFVDNTTSIPTGYYRETAGDNSTPPSNPIAYADLTFIPVDIPLTPFYSMVKYFNPTGYPLTENARAGFIEISGVSPDLNGQACYKSGGAYKLSVTFFDFADRKCGVTGSTIISGVAVGQASVQIPERTYSSVSYVTAINWTLLNDNAIAEIPVWANRYSIDVTKCLTTRFFLQARSRNATASMIYVDRDADNAYTFATNTYTPELTGVGIDITNLQNFSMGYVYADGDVAKVYLNGGSVVYKLKIIGQSGRYIICELQDLGTLSTSTDALFEIFTPYIQSLNEPYYEVAQMFPVLDAGTTSRRYSTLFGTIGGDVTLLKRSDTTGDYLTENMSPNDKYYLNWYTDSGRPNFIDTIGQQLKENSISYSNVLLPGTRTNGMSSFDALDTQDIPISCGAIMKLQVTSKVQDELGIVMLAICSGGQTASMYIGEVQLYGSNTPSTLAQAPNVIGTINILKGARGTANPESVIEFRGDVFWADANNHKWVQYSVNGLDDICYHTESTWNQWFQKFNSLTSAEIEALGGRPFIFTTVDPYHRELLVSIPKLSNTPPKGYLPDYPDMIYPFDILDFQAKTMVYKLGMAGMLPHWQGAYTFYAENFVTVQNKTYSFKNGLTYIHNQSASKSFYGIDFKARIMVVSNAVPSVPKSYNNQSVQSSSPPTFVYFYNDYPYQQSSDLVDYDFRNLEGIWYSIIYRNKLQPTFDGFTTNGLLTGEKMKNVAMFVLLEFNVPMSLKFIQIGYGNSSGHTNYINS